METATRLSMQTGLVRILITTHSMQSTSAHSQPMCVGWVISTTWANQVKSWTLASVLVMEMCVSTGLEASVEFLRLIWSEWTTQTIYSSSTLNSEWLTLCLEITELTEFLQSVQVFQVSICLSDLSPFTTQMTAKRYSKEGYSWMKGIECGVPQHKD